MATSTEVKLTGDETVHEVLLDYAKHYVKTDQLAKQVVDRFIAENRDYIKWVLERKCREKWAHCQLSFLSLDKLCLEALTQ